MPINPAPRITIVTPSFNQAKYLEETLESIFAQDYDNYELIVVDGGSTDGSQDIIRKYEHKIAWWVSEPDAGQSDAINKGFRRATGDLVAWVNSDDLLMPNCLSAVAIAYQQNGQPDIVHGDCIYIDADSKVLKCVKTGVQDSFWLSRGIFYALAPAIFFRRSIVEQHGFLDPSLHVCMDVDLWFKLLLAKARVHHTPHYLGCFRWHYNSKTSTAVRSLQKQRRETPEIEAMFDRYLQNSNPAKRRRWRNIWRINQFVHFYYQRGWLDSQSIKGKLWKATLSVENS